MRSRSDTSLTIALCASLVAHGLLMWGGVRQRIQDLTAQTHHPATADYWPSRAPEEAVTQSQPFDLIRPVQQTTIEPSKNDFPPLPEPEVAKEAPKPEPVKDDWGLKDGQGFASTAAPGDKPLSAPKGNEDQSFGSRDPVGPGPIPEEPSKSTALPGQGGDGRMPTPRALAGRGTQSAPQMIVAPNLDIPTPPAPKIREPEIASADTPGRGDQSTTEPRSALPAAPQRSPADPTAGAGSTNNAASGNPSDILPVAPSRLIGIPRYDPEAWPEVVDALTRPPGDRISTGLPKDLAQIAPADAEMGSTIAPATVAFTPPLPIMDEIAQLVGAPDPVQGPTTTDALIHTPGEIASAGKRSALPDLIAADAPGGDEIQNAITAMLRDDAKLIEMAQMLESGAPTPTAVASNQGNPGNNAKGGLPGPPVPAADSAADTNLESDPFSTIPNVEFRNGKVDAKHGRAVKPIRPRLGEAGRRDLLALQFPSVYLKVKIDNTGKVTDVKVMRGSGSDAIDMPIYRAMWEWWFEPPKDNAGNPKEDVQLIAIHWG